jgi:hypothetical protein
MRRKLTSGNAGIDTLQRFQDHWCHERERLFVLLAFRLHLPRFHCGGALF